MSSSAPIGVDIEWIPSESQFLMHFFYGTYNSTTYETRVTSVADVVEMVKIWSTGGGLRTV
jgi:hypothetical protein